MFIVYHTIKTTNTQDLQLRRPLKYSLLFRGDYKKQPFPFKSNVFRDDYKQQPFPFRGKIEQHTTANGGGVRFVWGGWSGACACADGGCKLKPTTLLTHSRYSTLSLHKKSTRNFRVLFIIKFYYSINSFIRASSFANFSLFVASFSFSASTSCLGAFARKP